MRTSSWLLRCRGAAVVFLGIFLLTLTRLPDFENSASKLSPPSAAPGHPVDSVALASSAEHLPRSLPTAAILFTSAETVAVSRLAAAVQRGAAHGQRPSMDRVCKKHQLGNRTWSRYQDKLGVKDIVREWSGGRVHTAATLLTVRNSWDVTHEIVRGLPDSFVVKSSHSSGGVIIVNKGRIRCLKEPCLEYLKAKFEGKWLPLAALTRILRAQCALIFQLRHEVNKLEVSYNSIPQGVIFEELLAGPDALLSELQVWVVHGRPFFVRHDIEYSGSRDRGGNPTGSKGDGGHEHDRIFANYFTTDGHHIPGLHIRHDCEATAPVAYANHCLSAEHDRPTLPLTPATRKLLMDFSALAAEKTGAKVLRVDVFRMSDTQLAFGELTFTSMRCDQELSPLLVDTALGVADVVPGLTSQLLGKLITHHVCRAAPAYTWARQPGCLQQCNDGECRPQDENANGRGKEQIFKSDLAVLTELDASITATRNRNRDPLLEKGEYFDAISSICRPFEAELGVVPPSDLRRQFATMRSAAQKVGALPEGAVAGRAGIQFPFEVKVVPELGRSVFPLETVPPGAAVWESTDDNVAHFHSRKQLEDHLLLLPDVHDF